MSSRPALIEPALRDDAFLADVAAARAADATRTLFVWWVGQSGFLLCHRGECLLFDPYLSDSLTRKYAATDKPHVRLSARVVDPARLDFVRAVTSTHAHTDHLDADTLRPLLAAAPGAKLVTPSANRAIAEERLGLGLTDRIVALPEGGRAQIGIFGFESVPAAHETLGPEYAGFVVEAGPFRVYHSGDTLRYDGMAERLRPHAVDLALLPVNGGSPERRVAGNLDGPGAAQLAHDIGARWVVPCHYDMFAFNTASPEPFVRACERLGQPHAVLRQGARWSVEARR